VWSWILDEERYWQKRHDVEKQDQHQEVTAFDLMSVMHWHPLGILATVKPTWRLVRRLVHLTICAGFPRI
jgi:hypothetical protein